MMKVNTILPVMALSIGTLPAFAQGTGPFFGGLSEAERTELAEERFAAADADGDGELTQDEMIAAAEEAERLRRQERDARMIEAHDSDPEIGAVMDLSVEAVESLIARGRRGLKAVLAGRREELGYEDD